MNQTYKLGYQLVARLLLVLFLLESCYHNTNIPLKPQVSKDKQGGGRHLELEAIYSLAVQEDEYEFSKGIVTSSELQLTSTSNSSDATDYAEASVAMTMQDSPRFDKGRKAVSERTNKVAVPNSLKQKSIINHPLTIPGVDDSKSIYPVIESQLGNAPKKVIKKEKSKQTKFITLTDKQFIAQGGHTVRFYEEAGNLRASVDESLSAGFSRKHAGLAVYLAADVDVAEVASLGEGAQKRLIEVHLPKSNQPGHVYVGKRGLLGGMKQDDGDNKKTSNELCEKEVEEKGAKNKQTLLELLEESLKDVFKDYVKLAVTAGISGSVLAIYELDLSTCLLLFTLIGITSAALYYGHTYKQQTTTNSYLDSEGPIRRPTLQKKKQKPLGSGVLKQAKEVNREEEEEIEESIPLDDYQGSLIWNQKAAKQGNTGAQEQLIQLAYINAKSKNITPLNWAIIEGYLELVKLLIHQGADLHARDNSGYYPIDLAAEYGHLEIVKYLIENGGDVTAEKVPCLYTPPLRRAVEAGHIEVVKYLLEKKSDGEKFYCDWEMDIAARKGYLEIFKLLIDQGADKDVKDNYVRTPLHIAAKYGYIEVVRYLIAKGADIEAKANKGRTPLHLAAKKGHLEIIKFLIDKGADLNVRVGAGYSSLHLAAERGHLEVVKYLVEKGADLNDRSHANFSPLQLAATRGRHEVVKYLVERGADLNDKRDNGESLLHLAAQSGHLEVVRYLVGQGADVNAKKLRNNTPLHLAAMYGHIEVVKFLVEKGANIHLKGDYDYTVLHCACSYNHIEVVKFLVGKGSNMHARNGATYSPLQIAVREGHAEIVEFLQAQRG
jgi:ankyrin repeat protein